MMHTLVASDRMPRGLTGDELEDLINTTLKRYTLLPHATPEIKNFVGIVLARLAQEDGAVIRLDDSRFLPDWWIASTHNPTAWVLTYNVRDFVPLYAQNVIVVKPTTEGKIVKVLPKDNENLESTHLI